MFGNSGNNLTEESKFEPCSPYKISKLLVYWITKNYRDLIIYMLQMNLFNHESPLRGETFVSKKYKFVASINLKK